MDISGRVALITGGASGLGRASANHFVEQGMKVVLLDLNEDLCKAAVGELGDDNAAYAIADVRNDEQVKAAIDLAYEKFGSLSVVVNCAGLGFAQKVVGRNGAAEMDKYKFVIEINLFGTFNVTRLACERIVKNEPLNADGERGVVINTASVAAFDGQMGQSSYSASKAGVCGMTLPMARDLARDGIRVCTIAPGIFNTPLMNGAPDKVKQPLIEMVQFPKRLGESPEFALLARHIVENPYLNGEVIRLDGAIRMQPR
ncbi:MAG: SDR family NAD(P)-dependent oxidoreductase [Gammaproteobacteria bacterium AqS3]|nr:SDR family NAD(P)-dependent oxidoreductase [Gammaproteobacteria bacterium AqS3]